MWRIYSDRLCHFFACIPVCPRDLRPLWTRIANNPYATHCASWKEVSFDWVQPFDDIAVCIIGALEKNVWHHNVLQRSWKLTKWTQNIPKHWLMDTWEKCHYWLVMTVMFGGVCVRVCVHVPYGCHASLLENSSAHICGHSAWERLIRVTRLPIC